MLRMITGFLLWMLEQDPSIELYWEWPTKCRGWKEAIIRYFMEKLQELNRGPWQCRMDGCRYGLKNDQGEFLNKAWTILTTDLHFYNEFRLKVCLKNHQHAWVHGIDTARSAYYPRAMCTSIARNWQKVLIPRRWLTMLWTAPVVSADPFKTLYVGEGEEYEPTTENEDDPVGPDSQPVMAEDEATEMEKKIWEAKLSRLHRAAGHPTSRNMARMLSDAQCPRWKVKMAMDFKCPICEESKPPVQSY